MSTVKYKSEEVIPIVAGVLCLSGLGMVSLTFKLALEGVYAKLKGLVSPTEVTKQMVHLVENLQDETSKVILDSSRKIYYCMEQICGMFSLKTKNLLLTEAKLDIYSMYYAFSSFGPLEEGQEEIPADKVFDLDEVTHYMCTLRGLFSRLCYLLKTGEVDMELDAEYWNWDIYTPHYCLFDLHSENEVINLISKLSWELDENYNKLIVMDLRS
ncbi:hypothetical protein ACSBL2_09970 [Pedobacter sp. AW31-3R]|uniref:hypothetical protein n=1 Tax=Pedobacter sp. AW31-3R TaxID=3445781 RepID=UPI003F9ECFA6